MRTCISRRVFAALLILFALSTLLLLPCGATELPDGVKDAVGDALNNAANDAADNLKDTANDIVDGVGEALPLAAEIAEAFLAGRGVEASNLLLDRFGAVVQLIVALAGVALCFYGYRLVRFAITVGGFVAGWILSMGFTVGCARKTYFPSWQVSLPTYRISFTPSAGFCAYFSPFALQKRGSLLLRRQVRFCF